MSIDFRNPNVCYVVGNGNLPENTAAGQISRSLAVGLLIDCNTSLILDACITLRDPLAIEFIRAQLVGRNFEKDFPAILESMERYQSSAQKSVLVALKAALTRFKTYRAKYLAEIG